MVLYGYINGSQAKLFLFSKFPTQPSNFLLSGFHMQGSNLILLLCLLYYLLIHGPCWKKILLAY
uniref:Uncharacterized protein n=1 Tax=Rhizophora mucronata TaxID=61149 RepID=A0A2P2R242_RHIMU